MQRKLLNQWAKLGRSYRLFRARQQGAQLGSDCRIARHVDCLPGWGNGKVGEILLGDSAWIEQGAVLWAFGGSIRLGRSVFLGPYVVIYGHGGVEIGEETLVSMHCCILSSNHTVPNPGKVIRQQPDIALPTKIGRDCWLGAGVRVLGGVTIGDGCVVGAGAVVTRDLPPYSIAMGVPARITGSRS